MAEYTTFNGLPAYR